MTLSLETLPQRLSLVRLTARILRAEISKGAWDKWLPAERPLCRQLNVSRNTLRAALSLLNRTGLIKSQQGLGNLINRKKSCGKKQSRSVNVSLLTPDALLHLRPTILLQIDELRAMLSERGFQLHVFHGHRYFSANPGTLLRKLVTQNDCRCWILLQSTASMQRWFEQNAIPCVVAGSTYAGIKLPFRDFDQRAIGRDAARRMLGLGHRKIAFFAPKSPLAGDIECEAGFMEGVHRSPYADVDAVICRHDATKEGVGNALLQLMTKRSPPTAILVVNALRYLTVATRLTQMGWRVPQQVSLISRDDDIFLSFLVPSPTRYVASTQTVAKLLLRPVLRILRVGLKSPTDVRTVPYFLRGNSLAPRRLETTGRRTVNRS